MNELIELTTYEIMLGAMAGMMRQTENLKLNRPNHFGAGHENDWQYHIEGCLGEYALAKFLNLYWSGKGVYKAPDLNGYEIRTRSKDYYDLILHPTDNDDSIFWLLCGINGSYYIKGWILGKDGKQEKFWCDPAGGRPAYFVPQSELKDWRRSNDHGQ